MNPESTSPAAIGRPVTPEGFDGVVPSDGERLSLGVAARLSRYLQVLIQARFLDISDEVMEQYSR